MNMQVDQILFMLDRVITQANAALSLAFSKRLLAGEISEGLVEKLENEYSFSPLKGNVIFGSSFGNWAFTLDDFAPLFAQAMGGANPEKVRQFMWGDFYFSAKDKKILKKPLTEGQGNIFTQFVLKNISNLYSGVLFEKDKAKLDKISTVLKIDIPVQVSSKLDSEPQVVVSHLLSTWLPLSNCFYRVAFQYLSSPAQSQSFRINSICKAFTKLRGNKDKYTKIAPFKEALEKANPSGPMIGYISKMIFVPNKNINDKSSTGARTLGGKSMASRLDISITNGNFFAFTRIFSGKLKVGDTIYLMLTHNEESGEESVKVIEVTIHRLYIWMGYQLDPVEEVGAGCICALSDLGDHSVKFATISSSADCPTLNKIKFEQNLLKVSVRTKELADMGKLNDGLKILKRVDPAIEMYYDEKGDIILETAGEVHLERCIKDLEDEFAKVELLVSEPIITFKETIISKKMRRKVEHKKNLIKQIKDENEKAFKEDNKKVRDKVEEDHKDIKTADAGAKNGGDDHQINPEESGQTEVALIPKAPLEEIMSTGGQVRSKTSNSALSANNSVNKEPNTLNKETTSAKKEATPSKKETTSAKKETTSAKKEATSVKKELHKKGQSDNQQSKEQTVSITIKKAKDESEKPEDPSKIEADNAKLYRWNSVSSSFFDTTSEEESEEPGKGKIDEKWLYDDDRNTETKDETDTRFIYKESNFVYQKKRVEDVKVTRKGVNMKMGTGGFLSLQKKKNHCEVLTQNRKFKLIVRAIGLGTKTTEFLYSSRNKVKKLFGNGPNMKRKADCLKFIKSLVAVLAEENEPAVVKLILKYLVSFGPQKIGPNLLLCKFAEKEETLTAPILQDVEEFKDIFSHNKKSGSYDKVRPDYEQYYSGISYEELIKACGMGFEMALEKGPLCAEEMYGCVFIMEDFVNCDEENIRQTQMLVHLKNKEKEEREEKERERKAKHDGIAADQVSKEASLEPSLQEGQAKQASVSKALEENKNIILAPAEDKPFKDNIDTEEKRPHVEGESLIKLATETSENMIEVIKKEGMSDIRSKNSKSIATDEQITIDPYGPMSIQLASAVKKGCFDSFLGAEPRLVQGILLCTVVVDELTLGSVLSTLAMRRAKIQENEYEHLTNMFIVKAHLAIQESFGFFDTIMRLTSGKVSPQLEFAGWEVIDMDPFYQPKTLEVGERLPRKRKNTGIWYIRKIILAYKSRKLGKRRV